MAELNLKQIEDKLNKEFQGEERKLVFWYDSNAEFIDDIKSLKLLDANIHFLEKDNQFLTKYILEKKDTKTNYLIYAPFSKPNIYENHLADTLLYSKEFYTDRVSLIASDLDIDEKYKYVLREYKSFFGAKDRIDKFYNLSVEKWNKETIEIGIMSVLCKLKVVSFEEVLRSIFKSGELVENKYLIEFEKHKILDEFWNRCNYIYDFKGSGTSILEFASTMFITYMSKDIVDDLPESINSYKSTKVNNITIFLDSIMNNITLKETFDSISDYIYKNMKIEKIFESLSIESMLNLEIFKETDRYIIKFLVQLLENQHPDEKVLDYTIPEICKIRRSLHYGQKYSSEYYVIENAYYLIKGATFKPEKSLKNIWESYISKDYLLDTRYRYFYYHYDKITENTIYEKVRELVENIYTNKYLDPLAVAWSNAFIESKGNREMPKQKDFFDRYLKNQKARVVVIISDAFRYEVGMTLMKNLEGNEKYCGKIEAIEGIIPSYTRFGMSVLLPHEEIIMDKNYRVLIDGKIAEDTKTREEVLKRKVPKSKAVQFDDIRTVKDAKELISNRDIIYVYHNQIDARGDKLNTENEVFTACEEAVLEIYEMIKRFTSAGNKNFIVTSDHGFIYKRDKLVESDKISGLPQENSLVGKRYVISEEGFNIEGTGKIDFRTILNNQDKRVITFPIGTDIFKTSGGGSNFVHGGLSLQEIVVPVINIRVNKESKETKNVPITLISKVDKITNLSLNIDFIQQEPVTDIFKETKYIIFFRTDKGEEISNYNSYIADRKDEDPTKRLFRLKFNFKNKKYDENSKYYLIIRDEFTKEEVLNHEVQIDLTFADDFGFNI